MNANNPSAPKRTSKVKRKSKAQAMVEFALALPILLLVMYGLIESGRLLFIYASVVSAARQAVRYGSVTGDNGSGTPYYDDCAGITAAANRLGFLQSFSTIGISYDAGPSTASLGGCPLNSPNRPDGPANGDRVKVVVSALYNPIVPLVPFAHNVTITSTGIRTLLVGVSVAVTAPGVILTPGVGGVITIVKQASPSSYDNPGITITYTYTVTNTGSDPVTDISVFDQKLQENATCPGGGAGPLAAGASMTCTATYVTTQADVDAGSITNVAGASGTALGTTVVAQTTLTINFVAKPSLLLTKEGTSPDVIDVGQLITYTFHLQNTGNVQLTGPFAIVDPLLGTHWDCSGIPDPFPINATADCTGSYPLTQNDLNRGSVQNTARATAMYKTFTVTSNSSAWTVSVPPLFLTVSAATTPPGNNVTAPGQTITYTYTIKNRSLKYKYFMYVNDNHGANGFTCSNWTVMTPGEQSSCTRNSPPYTVTQADIDAGSIVDQATAYATKGVSNIAYATTTVTQTVTLTLTKTSPTTLATSAGTVIAYTYKLKNDGNVTLRTPYTLTDDKIPGVSCAGAPATMAPGSAAYTCPVVNYTVTSADIANGSIVNHATATATIVGGTTTSNQAVWQVITFAGARMGLVKTPSPTNFTAGGQGITYTYVLKNTGGVPINGPFTLTDDKLGNIDCSGVVSLPIGGSASCATASYTTTATDTSITNNATAISTSPSLTATASITVPKYVCDSTTLKSTPNPIGNTSGSPFRAAWSIINNTGLPLTITSITVSWGPLTTALSGVTYNGAPIGNGYPSVITTGYSLPLGSPLPTLPLGTTPMTFSFYLADATNIHVVVTFSDVRCPAVDSNVIYPGG